MIVGIGSDLCDIERVDKTFSRLESASSPAASPRPSSAAPSGGPGAPLPTPSDSPPKRPAPRLWGPGSGAGCSGATWGWSIFLPVSRPCA